ncbi:MAG: glutaredoxin family protein [Burkholderiaceae bacterium]
MRQGFFGIAAAGFVATIVLAGWPTDAHAQFKWREADGRISYGDRLPNHQVTVLRAPGGWQRPGARAVAKADPTSLPYELRVVSQRYPVTVYTTGNCQPCDAGRQHLARRGVPYTEKTVRSRQDVAAFESLGFPPDTGLPVITVGAERQIGFQEVRWDLLLDTAGYPKESRLPANYVQAEPAPLAAVAQPSDTPADREAPRAALGYQGRPNNPRPSQSGPSRDPNALRF